MSQILQELAQGGQTLQNTPSLGQDQISHSTPKLQFQDWDQQQPAAPQAPTVNLGAQGQGAPGQSVSTPALDGLLQTDPNQYASGQNSTLPQPAPHHHHHHHHHSAHGAGAPPQANQPVAQGASADDLNGVELNSLAGKANNPNVGAAAQQWLKAHNG